MFSFPPALSADSSSGDRRFVPRQESQSEMAALCDRGRPLSQSPQITIIIHGEYTHKNEWVINQCLRPTGIVPAEMLLT